MGRLDDEGRVGSSRRRALRARIARTGSPCHLCGNPIDYSLRYPHDLSFELDHVVPIARGGDNALSNLAASHRVCNFQRGDMLVEEYWAKIAAEVPGSAPESRRPAPNPVVAEDHGEGFRMTTRRWTLPGGAGLTDEFAAEFTERHADRYDGEIES